MSKRETFHTSTGRVLSGEDLDRIATEVEEGEYDMQALKARRRGRPPMGSRPA